MSIFFEQGGQTIWNPLNSTGLLFVENVRALEQCVHMTSGIGAISSDEVMIDSEQLQLFLRTVIGQSARNQSLAILVRGVCVHIAAMLHCTGNSADFVLKSVSQEWLAEANHLASHYMKSLVQG